MNKKYLAFLLALSLMFAMALAGCGSQEASAPRGGVVRYAIWSAPPGVFHPHLYEDAYDATVVDNVFSGMLTLNPSLEFEPDLAEKFEISDDSLTVTYTLREGLKWHDGQPVTTADVVYTFEMIADPGYTGPRYSDITAIVGVEAFNAGEADSIEGIVVIDERTVSITTSFVFANALDLIGAKALIPKHIWKDIPVADHAAQTELLRNPVGTGPFKLKEFVPDQFAELVANEDFHFGRPNLDGLIIQVSSQETALAQLVSGQLDFVEVSSVAIAAEELEGTNIVLEQVMSRGYQYMGFNNRLEIFQNKLVRQAFMHAINRQGMVDNIAQGFGVVMNVPLASFSWAVPPEDQLNLYPYDKDKAIELLQQAGWEFRDGTMYRNGEPVKLSLKYPTGNVIRERSAPLIQQNLADIGIELELLIMDFGTLSDQVIDAHDFDLFLMGWALGVDPGGLLGIWHSREAGPGGWNMVGFTNDRADFLLEEGQKYLVLEDRIPIYHELVTLMNDEVPAAFLYSLMEGRAHNPKLKGLQLFPFTNFYGIHEWYLEK